MTTLDDISARLERLERMAELQKNVLDISETARLTGYSVKYLRLLIAQRNIPYYRRGNRLFFCRAEVESWMMQQRIPTNEEMRIKATTRSK